MEQRSKRRSLPARSDVGRTEIGDDVEPKNIRQQRPVAQLPGAALGWAMQDGVTVQADDVDTPFGMARDKLLDRIGVKASQLAFDLRNRTDAAQNRSQSFAKRPRVRDRQCWAGNHPLLTVGLDERRIDPIQRSTAHQPERAPQPL